LRSKLPSQKVIIGVGGIDSVAKGQQKLNAGASLIQIYTGFIYQGPALVKSLATL
jgi:dihydroorotate dehydrogenase